MTPQLNEALDLSGSNKENLPPNLENNGHKQIHTKVKCYMTWHSANSQASIMASMGNLAMDGKQRQLNSMSKGKIVQNIEVKTWKNRNKIRYKRLREELLKSTQNTTSTLQNYSATTEHYSFHSHPDINFAHTI